MKGIVLAVYLAWLGSAAVVKPTQTNAWRLLPVMPGVYLANSAKYSLFADGSNYIFTVQGKFDNGGKSPIESDGVTGIARGFFLQDMTYGFDSLDGFVVWYQGQTASKTVKWAQSSLSISKKQFMID